MARRSTRPQIQIDPDIAMRAVLALLGKSADSVQKTVKRGRG